jgi:hypothetical protein
MKVKELIDLLSKENPDTVVMLSIDSEGNEFKELYEIRTHLFLGEDCLAEEDYEELDEEDKKDTKRVLVFWP